MIVAELRVLVIVQVTPTGLDWSRKYRRGSPRMVHGFDTARGGRFTAYAVPTRVGGTANVPPRPSGLGVSPP